VLNGDLPASRNETLARAACCVLRNAYVNDQRMRKQEKCLSAVLEVSPVFRTMACVTAAHGVVAISIFNVMPFTCGNASLR
jgi:hypothetical protein